MRSGGNPSCLQWHLPHRQMWDSRSIFIPTSIEQRPSDGSRPSPMPTMVMTGERETNMKRNTRSPIRSRHKVEVNIHSLPCIRRTQIRMQMRTLNRIQASDMVTFPIANPDNSATAAQQILHRCTTGISHPSIKETRDAPSPRTKGALRDHILHLNVRLSPSQTNFRTLSIVNQEWVYKGVCLHFLPLNKVTDRQWIKSLSHARPPCLTAGPGRIPIPEVVRTQVNYLRRDEGPNQVVDLRMQTSMVEEIVQAEPSRHRCQL